MPEDLPAGAAAARLLRIADEDGPAHIIHLTTSEERARRIARFMRSVAPFEVLVFPPWDCLPYDRVAPSREVIGERIMVLSALGTPAERTRIVLTTPEAILQRVPAKAALRRFEVKAGERLDADELRSFCELSGYVLDERVDEVGEAAFRGQVVDLFPAGARSPMRLEMRDDRLVAIRPYDPLSQRSQGEIASLVIHRFAELAAREGGPERADESPALQPLVDYLPEARLVLEPAARRRCRAALALVSEAYRDMLGTAEGKRERTSIPEPDRLYLSVEEWDALAAERSIELAATDRVERTPSFAAARRPGQAFARFLKEQVAQGRRVLLAGQSEEILDRIRGRAERVGEARVRPVSDWGAVLAAGNGSLLAIVADLEEGFLDEAADLVVIAAPDVLGSRVTNGRAPQVAAGLLQVEAADFRIGDLVVHRDHGIGVLRGLERVATSEGAQEAVRLAYANETTLLVPIEEVDKLWRYGSQEGAVALDRLDTDGWLKRRARIEATLRKTARAMHAAALERAQSEAQRLVPPQSPYEQFVDRFPYSETPDQAHAIEAVLNDLASGRPMDRLVVGDVGFGKTEVALRAAAAVALAGRQVAIAAPTTVLAQQHCHVFARRFAGLGVEVGHLSRLVARREAARVKEQLADGSLQVVVGTHALAGKGVEFAGLGLVIIDEEHRFGTAHKRKLRQLAEGAHVLTLTATPIPRTLQAALVGLQDFSIIATPPARRRPIRTVSRPFDLQTIGAALRRERRRGGQSFVVVPRIEDIEPVAAQLCATAPDLDLIIVHGKLPGAKVDEAMVAFAEGKGDVLLSTSIIESGLDVPRANTMIVLRAELFGLAQLHQLRGRVGRGALQAYCWLMTDAPDLPEATAKRLNTLQAFDRLGAGMDIAVSDLDLRGAGDLMGEEQAGHAKLVGVGLYQELFADALRKARGEPTRRWSTDLQIDLAAWLPEYYAPEPDLRLSLYHRLARASETADIDRLADEFADRFGPPPAPVRALLELAAVRTLAQSMGISKIAAGPQGVALTFAPQRQPERALLDGLSRQIGDVDWTGERLLLRRNSETAEERLGLVMELLEAVEAQIQ